jgi:beta-1,4-mannosyl-glycoprotein beta-1,4-N-acetylglucosaminyltransferase
MRIFDTFPFDAELDLLEHRLRETYCLVDAFVLVEAAETYSGQPKDLTFTLNRDRFAWAAPKLRCISLDSLGGRDRTARERAAIQRDAVRLALRDAEANDVVLLLDVDEIASRSLLERLRAGGIDHPRRILMTRHYQHADALAPRSPCCPSSDVPFQTATPRVRPGRWGELDERWSSSSGVAAPFRELAARNAFDIRFGEIEAAPLPDGGRHFSSVDPTSRLERKLHRVFHTEWSGERETSPVHLQRCRQHGVHHRGWWYAECPEGPLPEDVERLADRLGDHARFAPFWRRKLVRAWAWVRLGRWLPNRAVTAIDERFDRLVPILAAPLLAIDMVRALIAKFRQSRRSTMMKPRLDISSMNSSTSRSHVGRSTA